MDAVTERPLEGRTAFVTGAGQGVGRGIALRLADLGASVVVAARRAETGEPVAEEIRTRGRVAACIVTDVTDRASIAGAVAATVEQFGSLEIVVHNALAGAVPHRLEDVDYPAHWDAMSRTSAWVKLSRQLWRMSCVRRRVTSVSAFQRSRLLPSRSRRSMRTLSAVPAVTSACSSKLPPTLTPHR